MRKTQLLAPALLLVLLLVACAPAPAPPVPVPQATSLSQPAGPAPTTSAPAMPATTAWEVEWNKTVEAAKKESKLVILNGTIPEVRQALAEAFKSRFGISIEFVAGEGSQLCIRTVAERRAGIYSYDVANMGGSNLYLILKPAGALERLEPVLFLPELIDPQEIKRVWRPGELNWIDKDHTLLTFAPYVKIPFLVNTNLVKAGEIKAYRDLLNPKWKGRIVMFDPTLGSGVGTSAVQVLGYNIMGWDYVRKLAEQQPALTRDHRQLVDWVAQGKYAIGLFYKEDVGKAFYDAGAPVAYADAEEGTYVVGGATTISLIADAPHPHAAKLFINWLLSKEGQTVFSKPHGAPSGRVDVSTEGLLSEIIPDPKKKYYQSNSEKELLQAPEAVKIIREIFGLLKK